MKPMLHTIAIDGACYHNGKPDSYAVGACFVMGQTPAESVNLMHLIAAEHGGTNQRAEILGLICALTYISRAQTRHTDFTIITDSEYILNAMRNGWSQRWAATGWCTATGDPVKNKDLWDEVNNLLNGIMADIVYLHVKGHVIPFGTVTRNNLLSADPTGERLLIEMTEKFDREKVKRKKAIDEAQKCSVRNNFGMELPVDSIKLFVCLNMMADAIASREVEKYKEQLASDFGNSFPT